MEQTVESQREGRGGWEEIHLNADMHNPWRQGGEDLVEGVGQSRRGYWMGNR